MDEHNPGKIEFEPIGIVHSPYKEPEGTPIQGGLRPEGRGEIEIFPSFEQGLSHIEGFSHIWVIYVFDRSRGYNLMVKPFMDDERRGVFATRAPKRPNPIGLSLLRLERRQGNRLIVAELDILDGTPVLDIKPYVERFDYRPNANMGWLEDAVDRKDRHLADGRFHRENGPD